jgi:hypothetical protein
LEVAYLCAWVGFTRGWNMLGNESPATIVHVSDVVELCSELKMRWVYAWRVVTSVTDDHPSGNRAEEVFVCPSVSLYYSLRLTHSIRLEPAMAAMLPRSCPQPAVMAAC